MCQDPPPWSPPELPSRGAFRSKPRITLPRPRQTPGAGDKTVAVLTRLLQVGSIAQSIGVYVPVKMLQKALGLVRLLLFLVLMTRSEYGLWGLGMLIFTVAGPVLSLGSHHGLIRYAGLYEARGQLRAFCRRMQWAVPAVTIVMTAGAVAGSGLITDLVIVSYRQARAIAYAQQRMICWAALANALVLALYYNMLGLMYGLRTYRLAAAVELLFGVAFTALGIAALLISPTGLSALLAHLAALVVSLAAGVVVIHVGLDRLAEAGGMAMPERPGRGLRTAAQTTREQGTQRQLEAPVGLEPLAEEHWRSGAVLPAARDSRAGPELSMDGAFRRVLRFGLVALVGATLWSWAIYVSFWLTSKICGTALGGVYHAFLSLGQPVLFVADAIWAVLFTHVAKRWETGQRATALVILETAYKAVSMAMLTLTLVVVATAPVWVRILPQRFRAGEELLPGLFMFFQVVIHLALMSVLAKLHERPIVIALAALWAVAGNVLLALSWLPLYGPRGAALAAGVGGYVGSGLVTGAYLLLCRVRLAWSTYFVIACPAILLLPVWLAAAAWACVVAVAILTPLMFDAPQKELLISFVRGLNPLKRRSP